MSRKSLRLVGVQPDEKSLELAAAVLQQAVESALMPFGCLSEAFTRPWAGHVKGDEKSVERHQSRAAAAVMEVE